MIEQIKNLDREKIFQPKPVKKKTIIQKIFNILGYGK